MAKGKNEEIKNLLILGNGADLNSGLKSSFYDFEKSLKEKIENIKIIYNSYVNLFIKDNNDEDKSPFLKEVTLFPSSKSNNNEIVVSGNFDNIRDSIKGIVNIGKNRLMKNDCSLWYIVFYIESQFYDKDNIPSWRDLEKIIKDFLTQKIRYQYDKENKDILLFDLLSSMKTWKETNDLKESSARFSIISNMSHKQLFLAFALINFYNFNYNERYVFLENELDKFEKDFKEYISNEVDDNYTSKLKTSLQKITGNVTSNILSFNYTNSLVEDKSIPIKNYINIHGNISSDKPIIIGIDSNFNSGNELNYNEENNIYPFTKTYKLMNIVNPNNNTVIQNSISKIQFFGHSLGDADYSYFQSIFDFYNIYSSNVKLEFIYSVHGTSASKGSDKYNAKDYEIKSKQSRSVFRLINNYGKTFQNKDHGKNLLHKLLLEHRLFILNLDNLS